LTGTWSHRRPSTSWPNWRAAERATWTRTLPWRAVAVMATGAAAGLLATQVAPDLAGLLAVAVAAGLGWRLRFRPSATTLAWRHGATGERRTARLLAPLERRGWAVLHDLAIPGTQANIDHLVIGPGGVLVIDSKQYRGRLHLDRYGMVWHGRHLLVSAGARSGGRPTRPTRSSASPTSRFPRSSPSTAPASPGDDLRPTASPSCPPGGCPTCCRPCRRSLGRSGWPGWPTEPACASAPPPDSRHR
jgi:Nuclease-related domain